MSHPDSDAVTDPGTPPTTAELAALIKSRLASFPDLAPEIRDSIAIELLQLLGDDFARFRAMYLAASITDGPRVAAFEEYVRRRAAVAGRALGPDEVAATIADFERLPAAYVAELAVPVPPPMPGAYPDQPGPGGILSSRRLKLFADWSDMKREILKGGSILGIAGMAVMTWQASKSLEVGGLLLVCGLAIVLYLFRRRGY